MAYDPDDRKQQAGRQTVSEDVMWRGSRRDQPSSIAAIGNTAQCSKLVGSSAEVELKLLELLVEVFTSSYLYQ